jgi:tetratricopeptide (TPR) repeat protein
MRTFRLLILCIALAGCVSCGRRQPAVPSPLIIHVLRDPSAEFAGPLRAADSQFALSKPHLPNGTPVVVATNEGDSYTKLLGRVSNMPPTLLIVDSHSKLPADVASFVRPATPESVCGAVAYVTNSVSGEERKAAGLYLQFLEMHCHGIVGVDWKAELAKAKASLRQNPQSAFWHNQAGVAYDALGDFGHAVKELKLARTLDPTNPGDDYTLFALYKRKGMRRAEREVLLDALDKDPNNPVGRFEFGFLLEQEKDWADSLREYQAAKRLVATIKGSQYVDPVGGYYDVDGVRDEVDEAINRVAKPNDAARNQK